MKKGLGKRKVRINYKRLFVLVFIFLFSIFILFKAVYYIKSIFYPSLSEESQVKSEVSKLIITEEETPKIYRVRDTQVLKDKSEFYKDILPGDFVLVYPNSKRVVIYRKSITKIVNYSNTLGI